MIKVYATCDMIFGHMLGNMWLLKFMNQIGNTQFFIFADGQLWSKI